MLGLQEGQQSSQGCGGWGDKVLQGHTARGIVSYVQKVKLYSDGGGWWAPQMVLCRGVINPQVITQGSPEQLSSY